MTEQVQVLQPMTAAEWRNEITIKFPDTGRVATIRSVGLHLYVKLGCIPVFVEQTILDALDDDGSADPVTGKPKVYAFPKAKTIEERKQVIALHDDFVRVSFVRPRVVDANPGPDEITVDDIDYRDKQFLLFFLGRPAAELATFRYEPGTSVEPVPDVSEVPQTPIGDHGSEQDGVGDDRAARYVDSLAVR